MVERSFLLLSVNALFLKLRVEMQSQELFEVDQLVHFVVDSLLRLVVAEGLMNFCSSRTLIAYETVNNIRVTRKKRSINSRKNELCSRFTEQERVHCVLERRELDFSHVWAYNSDD